MQEYTSELDALARTFERFGTDEAGDASPLYARLCRAIAREADLLKLAACSASRPVPNLFLAAVQYLLRREPDHELRAFYPSQNLQNMRSKGIIHLSMTNALEQ